ncbi:Cyclin-dependent kinase B1-1 [Zostera marina]|uniref:Cyclin-dependent kinase B1-1 n=1 Tax=Zostera marina TaxID=29655 RepID=A0A0K9Q2X4_ZOSMR|nr:Cyclin-dependent kinase B1-1 [Zostera marina]
MVNEWLLNVKQLDGNAYFVFEYLQYNLKEAMTFHRTEILTFNSRPETAEKIRILLYQLCKAILYLHDNGIIHCALRPDNILVDMMIYRLKIADFNPGKTFNIIHNQREDTDKILGFKYIPPEILLGAPHSTQGDMWNVGLIFAELLRGHKLFDAHVKVTSKAEQLKIMFSIWGTPTEETWPRIGKIISKYNYRKHKPFKEIIPTAGTYGFDLLTKMLCYDPSRRISAKEALDHPYFNSINKSEFD